MIGEPSAATSTLASLQMRLKSAVSHAPIDNTKGSTHMSNVSYRQHRLYSDAMRNPRLVACGLKLRAGFVGGALAGVSSHFHRRGNPVSMTAIALVGAALAWFGGAALVTYWIASAVSHRPSTAACKCATSQSA